jgi:ketosteroid isomerase-like protein
VDAPGDCAANGAAWVLRDTPTWMPRDKVDVAKRAVDAFNRRDVDGLFAELATPEFEWYGAAVRALGGDEYRGREGIERLDRDQSENWEELQNVAEEFRDLGDRVLVLGRLEGRGNGSGAPVDQPLVTIVDFRRERIWRARNYFDRAEWRFLGACATRLPPSKHAPLFGYHAKLESASPRLSAVAR